MDQFSPVIFNHSVAMLAASLAPPLATIMAVAVGCGDSSSMKSKKRADMPKGSQRSKRQPGKKASKSVKKSAKLGPSLKTTKSGREPSNKSLKKKPRITTSSASSTAKSLSKSQEKKPKEAKTAVRQSTPSVSSKSTRSSRSIIGKLKAQPSGAQSSSHKAKNSKKSGESLRSSKSSSKKKSDTLKKTLKKAKGKVEAAAANVAASNQSRTNSDSSTKLAYQPGELRDVCIDQSELRFPATGGERAVTVVNNSALRLAIKMKCSDPDLYRINPVYSFVEPGKSTKISIYRHNGVAKTDKLVFVTATVNAQATNPSSAFGNKDKILPVMVIPLMSVGAPSIYDMEAPSGRCICASAKH